MTNGPSFQLRPLLQVGFILLLLFPSATRAARVERAAFQSEHFEILIDSAKSGIIPYLAAQLESSYRTLTAYFDFRPEKLVQILFLDEDDYANGYAFSAQGWMVIFLPTADFDLRGRTAWLPNVLSHELAHIITLRKLGETSRFLGYQLSAAWESRVGDVASAAAYVRWYPTPAWFAEGLAQYGSQVCGHDTTDRFRRMILETARAHGELLTLPEMADFGWDGRRNEMIYTQGYGLIAYLYGRFGRDRMNGLLAAMRHASLEAAFRKELGLDVEDAYRAWTEGLGAEAAPSSGPGRPVVPLPAHPAYVYQGSPVVGADGSLAYLSSAGNDYGIRDLFVVTHGAERLIRRRADGPLSLSPDGTHLYFTCLSVSWKTGRLVRDLYQYGFSDGRTTRLTWKGRVTGAAPDPSGTLYALSEAGGRIRLNRVEAGSLTPIAEYPVHVNLSGLATGDESGRLFAEVTSGRGSDLYRVDVADGRLTPVVASAADERSPRWDAAARRLVFAADYAKTYRIYALANDSILPLAGDGPDRLDPMVSGNTLYSRVYGRPGFVLDSSALAAPGSRGFARESLTAGQAFAPATPVPVTRKEWGDDGLKYLGYAAFAGLTWSGRKTDLFRAGDTASPLYGRGDPGEYFRATLGAAGIWMHPGSESEFQLQAAVADEFGNAGGGPPYLSDALAAYTSRAFPPMLRGEFASVSRRLPADGPGREALSFTWLRLALGLDWRLDDYFTLSGFGEYTGISLKGGDGLLTDFSGGGAFFGQQLGFALHQPGVDFANSLFAAATGLGYAPAYGRPESFVNWNSLSLGANALRRVFFHSSSLMVSRLSDDFATEFETSAFLSLNIPASLRLPPAGGRGFFLAAILPTVGIGYRSEDGGEGTTSAWRTLRARVPEPVHPVRASFRRRSVDPGFPSGRSDLVAGLTMKTVSPLRNIAYWDFYYSFPIQGESRDGIFGFNLSL